jgi:hypothetical protein
MSRVSDFSVSFIPRLRPGVKSAKSHYNDLVRSDMWSLHYIALLRSALR